MDTAMKVLNQVIVIFILIGVGFFCTKKKWITEVGVKQMTAILLNFVTPCVLIRAYQEKTFQPDLAMGLLSAAVFTLISILLSTLLSRFFFKKEETKRYRVSKFCAVYSNCGFMAIPLLSAALGADGVFYGSAYLAVFTVLYWTVGVFVYTEDKKELSFQRSVLNPGVLGTLISVILFVCGVKLPTVLMQPIGFLADINTPLAMIILGSYLVQIKLSEIIRNKDIYLVSLLRLIVYPLLSLGIACLLRLDTTVAQTVMISAACPVAAISVLFATKYDLDAKFASQIVSVSTLLSIFTIPLITTVTGLVF